MLTTLLSDWSMGLELTDGERPEDAWMRARTAILSSVEFSKEERELLESSSLKTFTLDLHDFEARQARESRVRRFVSKTHLKPLLDGLISLDSAITYLASTDPHGIAPLVWGGIRIVCQVIMALDTPFL